MKLIFKFNNYLLVISFLIIKNSLNYFGEFIYEAHLKNNQKPPKKQQKLVDAHINIFSFFKTSSDKPICF